MAHAVRGRGIALAGSPSSELAIDVVAGQPQQPRNVGDDAGQGCAVALGAGRDLAGCVPVVDQLAPVFQNRCRCVRLRRGGIRQVQCGEVLGDFAQVTVIEWVDQAAHQGVMAAPFPEIDQLVVQVARRLASESRVVAVRAGATLLTVACGARQRALRHGVLDGTGIRNGVKCDGQTHRESPAAMLKVHGMSLPQGDSGYQASAQTTGLPRFSQVSKCCP